MKKAYLDDWMDNAIYGAYWGDSVLYLVVPFLHWCPDEARPFQALVDPRYVLGASIDGLPEHVDSKEVAGRIEQYATPSESNSALYDWYRPLGILTAHEGKHRVAFMRAHGQPAIAAQICERDYPAADRLVLIKPDDERDEWLAILDGRYVQVLRRPQVSARLLTAYGVKVKRWREVPGLPSEWHIRRDIDARRLHKRSGSTRESERTLDLEQVRKQYEEDTEQVRVGVMDIEPYRWDLWRYLIAGAAVSVLGLMMLSFKHDVVRTVGAILMGGGLGLMLGPGWMRFVGPRTIHVDGHRVVRRRR